MATITEPLSEEKMHALKKELVEALIHGLEKKQLTTKEMRESANYILDHLPGIKSDRDLQKFLDELAQRWSVYSTIQVISSHKNKEKEEQVVIDKLSHYLQGTNS